MARASSDERIELAAGEATALVEVAAGGRLGSLSLGGHELLIGSGAVPGAGPDGPEPIAWGLYPMAPWAGRIRHGRFSSGGVEHRLPLTLPPHAIHGTAYTSADWRVAGGGTRSADGLTASADGLTASADGLSAGADGLSAGADGLSARTVEIAVELGDPWPWPARVEQRIGLGPDRLRLELTLANHAPPGSAPMPASIGWHPWFRRRVAGAEAQLRFPAASMFELDPDGIPTGRLVPPPPGPWDDCFTDLAGPPVIAWPGVAELTLTSSCRCWVVYDRPAHALCVEPQTDAPDAVNRLPRCELAAGETLTAWFEIRWRETTP
ncbi:MAG: hypothetical protein R2761_04000 [Acidimicrobiales bacterium]